MFLQEEEASPLRGTCTKAPREEGPGTRLWSLGYGSSTLTWPRGQAGGEKDKIILF